MNHLLLPVLNKVHGVAIPSSEVERFRAAVFACEPIVAYGRRWYVDRLWVEYTGAHMWYVDLVEMPKADASHVTTVPIIRDNVVEGDLSDYVHIVSTWDLVDPLACAPQPCDTCTNEGSCKTIGQCLRYKCEFGKVDKP